MTLPLFAAPIDGPCSDPMAPALFATARILAERLGQGGAISRKALSSLMRAHVGGSDACGDWSMRDAYDALEMAQVLRVLDVGSSLVAWDDPASAFAARAALGHQLPTQRYRSERQIDLQQFSTPLGLAWFVACAAGIEPTDLVLEPSAGTGMLAVHAKARGARMLLNERDPRRAALLSLAFGQPVTQHDGEHIDALLGQGKRPTSSSSIRPSRGRKAGAATPMPARVISMRPSSA